MDTVMSAVPLPAGERAVIDVALLTVTEADAVEPKWTLEPERKPVPVMMTEVPPVGGPWDTEMALTDGTGR